MVEIVEQRDLGAVDRINAAIIEVENYSYNINNYSVADSDNDSVADSDNDWDGDSEDDWA